LSDCWVLNKEICSIELAANIVPLSVGRKVETEIKKETQKSRDGNQEGNTEK
jgi:hypothetical protein